ncbi:MAG TPA: AAA family ATPase, partial [Streptosporangiaceae bacterium]
MREVAGLLEEYRLVTVTGPGGVGKTRLADEVARHVAADRFADGAWLAELAPVRDPAQVAAAVAVAIGVREQPGVPAAEAVARVLARQQLLLVLDNCEHVIGAAAQLCADLLQACDDVRVLATSREPLRIAGEAAYRLAPLPVPGPGDAGDDVAGAVVLFADRARAADAGFALTGENRADVARLVGRLDGMPLAIELAAARAEALGVSQLLESLDGRLALLAGGDRLAAGRHRSLAAAAEWSYQLLEDQEQRVFRLVSVFPAPFTLEAAGAVAGPGAAAAVLRLVECSLLVPPRPGLDGRSRYAMLETLRGYGTGLLAAAGEQDDAEAALARYALRAAEQAAAGLRTIAGEPAAARWLDAEDAAMGHALGWAADHDLDTAARLVTALALWWLLRGRLAGQQMLLRELAGRAGPGSDGWCAAQFWLAWMAHDSADLPGSLQRCAAIVDVIGDRKPSPILADCLALQSDNLANLGRVPEAAASARRALAMARELGYPFGQVHATTCLVITALYAGDLDHAARLARQGGQVPDIPRGAARICGYLLAGVLAETGNLAAAERACAATLVQARDAGDLYALGAVLPVMADLDLRAGRRGDAAAHLREAAQLTLQTGLWFTILNVLEGSGHLCAATGRPADAITAWVACETLGQQGGFENRDTDPHARLREEPLRQARQALGPDQARAAEQRGAAMSAATAAEYALMLTTADPPQPAVPAGPGKLSARERELVTLVARGRTDAQIAA